MPYEILERESIAPAKPQQQAPQYNPILKGLTNFAQSGLESTGNLVDLIGSTLVGNVPHITPEGKLTQVPFPKLGGAIRSASEAVLPEGYLDKEEGFARRAGAALPGAAASLALGTAPATAAVAVLGGAAGETGAKQLGFKGLGEEGGSLLGSLAQLGGSLLGSSVANKGLNFVSKLVGLGGNDLTGTAKKIASEFYEREKELGKDIFGPGRKYKQELQTFKEEVGRRGIPSNIRKELVEAANAAQENITGGAGQLINGSALAQIHKDNNKLYKLVSENEPARKLFDKLQNITMDTAKNIGKDNPEWLKSWIEGDEIYSAFKYSENIKLPFVEKVVSAVKNPLVSSVLAGLGFSAGYKKPLETIGIAAGSAAAGHAARSALTIKKFLEKPSTQRILQDVFKGVVNREIPQFTKSIQRLDKLANTFEREIKSQQKEEPASGKKIYEIIA